MPHDQGPLTQKPDPMADGAMAESSAQAEQPVDALLRVARTAQVYRSADGGLHARVAIGDRLTTYPLKSLDFRNWLTDAYFADQRQAPLLGAMPRVIALLQARAWADDRMPPVYVRVGRDPGDDSAYYLDLGDSSGTAIWISAEGWVRNQ